MYYKKNVLKYAACTSRPFSFVKAENFFLKKYLFCYDFDELYSLFATNGIQNIIKKSFLYKQFCNMSYDFHSVS